MTIPPIASEAAASSCPDWMTDDYLRQAIAHATADEWRAKCFAREVLRLRAALGADQLAMANYDSAMRALESDLKKAGIAAHGGHLPSRLCDALDELNRLRKENETLRSQEKHADAVIAHIRRCMTSIDGDGSLCDLSSRVGAATAELVRLRKESKRERAEKAEALLAEVARILGGTGDVVQRARAVTSKLRTTEADREEMLQNLAGISTIACAESLEHYRPGCSWERAALSDVVKLVRKLQEARADVVIERSARENDLKHFRAEFERLEKSEAEVQRVRAEHTKEVGGLSHDLAKARAERNEFAALELEKLSSNVCGNGEDALIERALELRGEAKKLRSATASASTDPAIAPMRRDACGRIVLATPVRTPQSPSTEALADIAYCRRDPTLQESRSIAGELLERRTSEKGPIPAGQQRFSLGTKFHDAMRRACGRGSGFSSGPIGFAALAEAVEALGAAVEAELS